MKAIMLLFDSLNRDMLSAYGCDFTHTPNFQRLYERTVRFDNSYIGSMPCIPARRELHTGRYNFLHRSWGPIEPFDDSAIELLTQNGVYTHMITDHQHYWEDGGATFHNRYNTYEFIRGQEGDKWKASVKRPEFDSNVTYQKKILLEYDIVNRRYIKSEDDQPQKIAFDKTFEFLDVNKDEDNWFLHLECFDPHEPFLSFEKYKELYPGLDGSKNDWPNYGKVQENDEEAENLRLQYCALLSMCDHYLGKLIDYMDEHNMWEDTMLIVNTDHGFLLNEHDCWGKMVMPFYNKIARTPFFVWDPRVGKSHESRESLVQGIDIPATLLEFFGMDSPPDMAGKPLRQVLEDDTPIRDSAMFGMFGGHACCTDGRYVYMRGVATPDNKPLNQYTLMPTHMRRRFCPEELQSMELVEPFSFTKGCKVMKVEAGIWDDSDPFSMSGITVPSHLHENLLYDISEDPGQETPLDDPEIEEYMKNILIKLMKENDAPNEQFVRLGLV